MGQEGGSVLPARKQQLEITAVGGVFEVAYTYDSDWLSSNCPMLYFPIPSITIICRCIDYRHMYGIVQILKRLL